LLSEAEVCPGKAKSNILVEKVGIIGRGLIQGSPEGAEMENRSRDTFAGGRGGGELSETQKTCTKGKRVDKGGLRR